MELSSCPSPHPQAAFRIMDGSAVIVLADSGEVTVLNEVGTRIWGLADKSHTVAQIVEAIEAEFDVSPEQARQDVEEFLETLLDIRALVL